jgi:hypothetical protein
MARARAHFDGAAVYESFKLLLLRHSVRSRGRMALLRECRESFVQGRQCSSRIVS